MERHIGVRHLRLACIFTLIFWGTGINTAASEGKECDLVFGGHRILKKLGVGSYGTVYEALKRVPGAKELDQVVALKLLDENVEMASGDPEPELVREFRHEFALLSRFSPPNPRQDEIIQVLEFGHVEWTGTAGKTRHRYFFTMEPFRGENLEDRMRQGNPIAFSFVVKVGLQVAQAIAAMAAAGVVHGDIKPGNMLVMDHQSRVRIRLVDFGLARLLQGDPFEASDRTLIVGTPLYLAPELTSPRNLTDTLTDLYALGVTLHELLTDKFPYDAQGEAQEVVRAIETGKQRPIRKIRREIPENLAAVVDRLLARDRRQRYRDPDHVIRDLSRVLQDFEPR